MILSSVCLSVTLCNVTLKVGVGGWKLYRRVPSRALPIHFFRHLLIDVTFRRHSEKPNRQNFRVWNSHGQRGHVTTAIPDEAFSVLQLYRTSYAVRSAFLATATFFLLTCSISVAYCWLTLEATVLTVCCVSFGYLIWAMPWFWGIWLRENNISIKHVSLWSLLNNRVQKLIYWQFRHSG